MPYGLYLSAAGANAQSHRLETLSNNLANINTAGFKPHLSVLEARQSEGTEQGATLPGQGTIDDLGGGVGVQPALTQFSKGAIRPTGNKTDFALSDRDSFFAVQHEDQELLTRAGNFTFDSNGTLVTPGGAPVLSTDGTKIRIDPSFPFHVSDDGAVQQGNVRQMLKLVKPRELGDLSRVGENLFEPLTAVDEVQAENRTLISGALESSAVEPTGAMMELIEASRVYEANVRMIQSQDQALGQLIGRVLRQS